MSAENFLAFFGVNGATLPSVTIDSALTVPAVNAAVNFLSRTMAALPLHAYRDTPNGPERMGGKMEIVIHENPNPGMDSFKFRQYFWQNVFTGGRGLAWIERTGSNVEALWPMDPAVTVVQRVNGKLQYQYERITYAAEDVIDVPYMLRANQTGNYGPINLASRAIQLSLAMNEYGSLFFAGGGVPPLAMVGPLPAGTGAMTRALADVSRAIEAAKSNSKPIFPMPPGYDLKQVGFDPEKGQMTDARRFQIEEIARAWQLPPVFLQDLTRATFSNSEQQDLHLVKHLVGQWAQALEGEMNLKLFGRLRNSRYVEHNLDGLLRGDFTTRLTGIVAGVSGGVLEPNRGRNLMGWPNHDNAAADDLFIQGATVPLGTVLSQPQSDGPSPDGSQPGDGTT